MESQPQNPEFRINPENFHPCLYKSNHDQWEEYLQWLDGVQAGLNHHYLHLR